MFATAVARCTFSLNMARSAIVVVVLAASVALSSGKSEEEKQTERISDIMCDKNLGGSNGFFGCISKCLDMYPYYTVVANEPSAFHNVRLTERWQEPGS